MAEIAAKMLCSEIAARLRGLRYHVAEEYAFPDWFSPSNEEQCAAAAAFAQTPISYDSSCIGVIAANGLSGARLIDRYRALAAPVILEVDGREIREWAVSSKPGGHEILGRYPVGDVNRLFVKRAAEWKPDAFLRAKNIGTFQWSQQLSLFAGLLPELEVQIQEKMDPLLRDALSVTKSAYRQSVGHAPDPEQLFKLVFWLLTAKVFRDRGVGKFARFNVNSEADEMLRAVADQYKTAVPRLLNKEARAVAASRIWRDMDFRNLSVEVLAQMWSHTLVDAQTQRRLGIHRTSRTIVRYLVERVPFDQTGDDARIVLEPCSGSGVFLVGAMNVLRHNLFLTTPEERHDYFVKHLAGIERDAFGVEISRLALTLADFPNPNGWNVVPGDVFDPNVLKPMLQKAGVVLCNPPFEEFEPHERGTYELRSHKKPAELLHRVLDDLHPDGVLGFVLPRKAVDGRGGYADVRRRLAERFATIDLTILPDKAFPADAEIALLVAKDPIPHDKCRVTSRRVDDSEDAWRRFEHTHETSAERIVTLTAKEAEQSLVLPELADVWDFLVNHPTLGEVAEIHRGIEWPNHKLTRDGEETGRRGELIRDTDANGYRRGIPPKAKFHVFEQPATRFLSMRPEHLKKGILGSLPWDRTKTIVNKTARSRRGWRMAAFPDSNGLVCYQTFTGVWPKAADWDEWSLAAVLNGPVANAFVATHAGKVDVNVSILSRVPMPILSPAMRARLRKLIIRYRELINAEGWMKAPPPHTEAARVLTEIDALVLDGYGLPARIEHELLEFFRGQNRPTPFEFDAYLPLGEDTYFNLSERISPEFKAGTAAALLKRLGIN